MISLSTNCSTQKQRAECELIQHHYKGWDQLGGLVAIDTHLIESGFDTSSLIKPGMPLKEWCNNNTFHALDAFGLDTAERVNKMTRRIKASNAGEGSSLGQTFFAGFRFLLDNKRLFPEGSVLSEALRFVRECKTLFSEAYHAVMESLTRLSEALQVVTGYKTPIALIALVIVVGVMLRKDRRPGEKNVLKSNSTEDEDKDDDGGDNVDGLETGAGDDGDNNNNGDEDSGQLRCAMCRVILDEASDACRTPKALPRYE